jgi:hypothetical protein
MKQEMSRGEAEFILNSNSPQCMIMAYNQHWSHGSLNTTKIELNAMNVMSVRNPPRSAAGRIDL